jgi:hypothetical protein
VARRTVSDSDTAVGTEGFARLHTGRDHIPYPAAPPPLPHPEPGPQQRNKVPTGAVMRRAH